MTFTFAILYLLRAATDKPIMAGDSPVTLDQAIRASLQRPVFSRTQQAVLDQSIAHTELLKTAQSPTFEIQGLYNTGYNPGLGLSDVSLEREKLAFSANYYLYDAGMRSNRVQAAKSLAKAQTETNDSDKLTLIGNVTTVFFEGLSAKALLDVAQSQKADAAAHLVDVAERLKLGNTTKGELLTAQSAVDSADSAISLHKADLESSEIKLALLMGLDSKVDRPEPTIADEPNIAQADAKALIVKAEANSPVLASLKDQKSSAQFSLQADKSTYRPVVSARGGAGFVGYQDPFSSGHSTSGGFANVGLQLVIPLFDKSAYHETVREGKDIIALKQLAYQDATEQLETQIELAVSDLNTTKQALKSAQSAESAATEAYRLSRERYSLGLGTQMDVLNALLTLTTARDTVAGTKLRLDSIILNLERLTGEPLAQK
ncbi:MAG TPA: TolC family protein [Fimbriimonadaceae bacterium]|jgi:outer membrane protein TolC